MGYPAAVQAVPTSEPVSAVLGQAFNQLEEAEKRLHGIRDRIENRNQLSGGEKAAAPTPGVLNQALALRNMASRIMDRCNELEGLL